jgi:hypothetical protein
MSALTRGIVLDQRGLARDKTPRDEPRYTVAEAVHILAEQGWTVVRRNDVFTLPKAVETPYVLARLKTACDCTREIFITDRYDKFFDVPIYDRQSALFAAGPPNDLRLLRRRFVLRDREFREDGVRIAHFEEQV